MDDTMLEKVVRLARTAASHPRYLPKYFLHLPVWGQTPIDLEIPWFSYGAIEFLDKFLKPTHSVFEFGSGGSSLFMARRVQSVLSVENDPNWYQAVVARAKALGIANLTCELHSFGDGEAHRFADLPYFHALEPNRHDVIVVDGFCGYSTGRYGLLRPHAFKLAVASIRRPGGIVVVDDYWMYPDFPQLAPNAKLTVFESLGPCRYGGTSTAIFEF